MYISLVSYLLLAIPLIVFFLWRGLEIIGDGVFYINQANTIINRLVAGGGLAYSFRDVNPFYLLPIGLLAITIYFSGKHWQEAILIANAIFFGLCAPSVYLLYRLLGGAQKISGAVFAAIIPMSYPEVLFLGNIPLRDIPFTGVASLVTVVIIWSMRIKISLFSYLFCLGMCVGLIMFRPNAIIFIAATTAVYWWAWWAENEPRLRVARQILLIQLFCSIVIIALFAWWFSDPFPLPIKIIDNLFRNILVINQGGNIIIDHTDMVMGKPNCFYNYLSLLLHKFIYYFRYWNPKHGTVHFIYRHIYFGALIINFVWIAIKYICSKSEQNNKLVIRAVLFNLSLAIAGATLHSVLVLAYEFRYQMIIFTIIWAIFLITAVPLIEKFIFSKRSCPK